MENMSDNRKKDVLPEFQAFLLDKKLAQENAVIEFIETMKSDSNVSDWQIRQAGDAIRLYYFHYRGFKLDNLLAGKSFDFAPELLAEAKRLIRLKHYSYSTEKTYLQWIKRFLDYAKQTGRKQTAAELGTADCKNFLSYLAVNKRVAGSTQNQALN